MGLFDAIPGAAEVIGIGKRILTVFEAMVNRTDIKEKWKETGNIKIKFTVNDRYLIHLNVADLQQRTIEAEVEPAEPMEECDDPN